MESEFLLRAFHRDFETNGPSLVRVARTLLLGWRRYKAHPDPRIRRRFRCNPDIQVVEAAVASAEGRMRIGVLGDASSAFAEREDMVDVAVLDFVAWWRAAGFDEIALLKINIEGGEYELLEELGISHLRKSPAAALSGGERRRVEIARALATSPRFILLDEPFAGVDPIAVIDIQKTIRFLKERGIGVLITDHNVRETLGICDRAYIINAGEVLASGRPEEIVYNESVRKVYLGEHFRL